MKNIGNKTKIERARGDLRLGIPVIVSISNQKYLISALETIDEDTFALYQGGKYELIIPSVKAELLLGIDDIQHEGRCRLRKTNVTCLELQKLVFDDPNLSLLFDFTKSCAEDTLILRLIKSAELLPDVLLQEIQGPDVISWCSRNNIAEVTVQDIIEYFSDVQVKEICRSPLVLKGAEDASIIAYRSAGKDHYAIIIGNPCAQEDPVIRIHSSCYTGDLLDSLACDCGSQLKSTIDFMAKNNGGIILYLLQEGRNIGLTNKIRTYYQQACNHLDTVEANRIIGFADDERDFNLAAEILKDMGIVTIKLITNNKNKILQMQNNGITVSCHIKSHIKCNKYNMHYLHTKFSKLDHIINY